MPDFFGSLIQSCSSRLLPVCLINLLSILYVHFSVSAILSLAQRYNLTIPVNSVLVKEAVLHHRQIKHAWEIRTQKTSHLTLSIIHQWKLCWAKYIHKSEQSGLSSSLFKLSDPVTFLSWTWSAELSRIDFTLRRSTWLVAHSSRHLKFWKFEMCRTQKLLSGVAISLVIQKIAYQCPNNGDASFQGLSRRSSFSSLRKHHWVLKNTAIYIRLQMYVCKASR